MLVLDEYKNYQLVDFEIYYKIYNIISIYLSSHFFYITQLFNVEFFNPLKKIYNKKINIFIRAHINNITKIKFFLIFRAAYKCSIIILNIIKNFRGAGLIPLNSKTIFSKLNIKLRTLIPTEFFKTNINF